MERREPPETEEGWYALHDFRTIDWDAWREAPEALCERAIEEGIDYLASHAALEDIDTDDGVSAVFSVLGHEADLMTLHLRPSMADIEVAERRFEHTSFADFTTHTGSFVSVTEASGYTTDLNDKEMDASLRRYIDMRLHPTLPDAEYVCFYPMSKRRGERENWYDLSFEQRAEHMSAHGDIGRKYAGKVTQIVTGSVGFDDWEWGVTLFADNPTHIKRLLYEMRFDPSTSRYAEFGSFRFGRRFPPTDLDAWFAGEPVPTDEKRRRTERAETDRASERPATGASANDRRRASSGKSAGSIGAELDALGIEPDVSERAYGVLVYSETDHDAVAEAIEGLRGNFDHYDSHIGTTIHPREDGEGTTVVSRWATERAAETAAGFLADLPSVSNHRVGPLDGAGAGGDGGTIGADGDGVRTDDVPASADEAKTEMETETGARGGAPPVAGGADGESEDIRDELEDVDVYAGQPHGEDVYALVVYSGADSTELAGHVDELRKNFEDYDTHVKTAVYENPHGGRSAIVTIWKTRRAAETASGFLSELPAIVGRAGEESGFGTMGMFYTVKPEHRDAFIERFDAVDDLLADMDGHFETSLLVNRADENDMFIASQWGSREDAMSFFRSDAFHETVQWGREILADRPRHVFLA